jgi:SAM-dependent methyltransferase
MDRSLISVDTRRLMRILTFVCVAWVPAMSSLLLVTASIISREAAIIVSAAGAGAALVVALKATVSRRLPRVRVKDGQPPASWLDAADPRANHAVRWAMYEDLVAWMTSRDWADKVVVEFGSTNGILKAFAPNARYIRLDFPEHDIQDLHGVDAESIDLILLDQTLEHVPDPERAIREVHRVLKPRGTAVITTPFLLPVHQTSSYGDYTRWTPEGMRSMLLRHGLDPDVRWWGNLPAAQAILEDMYLTADEAARRGIPISGGVSSESHPIVVWALATRAR